MLEAVIIKELSDTKNFKKADVSLSYINDQEDISIKNKESQCR
jgi:hypothetical protein